MFQSRLKFDLCPRAKIKKIQAGIQAKVSRAKAKLANSRNFTATVYQHFRICGRFYTPTQLHKHRCHFATQHVATINLTLLVFEKNDSYIGRCLTVNIAE